MKDAYDPEFDSPEARANYATRHIRNLSLRRQKREELLLQYEAELVEMFPGIEAIRQVRKMTLERKLNEGFSRKLSVKEMEVIRANLSHVITDWLGSVIPAEGSEDYSLWQCRVMDLEDCESIEDFREFLEPSNLSDYIEALDVDNILKLIESEDEDNEEERLDVFTRYYLI